MRRPREYVIECEHVTDAVWSPVRMFVDESVSRPLVRCRDCRHAAERNGRLVCRVRPMTMHVTEPDGFCHRGEI